MRRQARKRKEKRRSRIRIRIPRVALAKLSVVPGALLVVFLSYELSGALLDRPIRTIRIEGPFERVSALQIEAAIGDELERGFFSASLAEIHDRIVALPWIDKANVARRWPDTLEISVTEQVPAACWGERGLMNTRGELFVENARHIPAELPRLSGPDGSEAEVARRYLEIRRHPIPLGLDLRPIEANVARRWPDTLEISVTEQVPAACWGERGLMNTRGELFVENARHIPAELPRLSGPDGSEAEVARRYLEIRRHLIPLGLDLRRVHLDARGAWDLTLSNGVEIRLGRRDTDVRTQLFLDVVANIVASREGDIEFVDMRYSNGFSIGWEKDAGAEPVAPRVPGGDRPEMVG